MSYYALLDTCHWQRPQKSGNFVKIWYWWQINLFELINDLSMLDKFVYNGPQVLPSPILASFAWSLQVLTFTKALYILPIISLFWLILLSTRIIVYKGKWFSRIVFLPFTSFNLQRKLRLCAILKRRHQRWFNPIWYATFFPLHFVFSTKSTVSYLWKIFNFWNIDMEYFRKCLSYSIWR